MWPCCQTTHVTRSRQGGILRRPIGGVHPSQQTAPTSGAESEQPQSSAYGQGWLIKIKMEKGFTLDHLMPWTDYQKQIASESH
jgi:hypothetical protein